MWWNKRWLRCGVGICALAAGHTAYGADSAREFRSARFLGMGDAGVALAAGHDSLFYNPAGISDVESIISEIVVLSPMVSVSSSSRRLYNDYQQNNDFFPLLEGIQSQPQHVSVQNFTGLVFKRAALGTVQKAQVDLKVGPNTETGLLSAELDVEARAGMLAGFAREFRNKTIHVGIAAKAMQKMQANVLVNALSADDLGDVDTKSLANEYVKRGNGFGADLGFLWIPKTKNNFRFGLTARNVGTMRYRWPVPATGNAPDPDVAQIDVGVAVGPTSNRSRLILAMDLHDALGATKESIYKRIHVGAGLSLRGVVGFMGGFNQGYPTYGGFLNFRLVRCEMGMYSEELGKFPGDLRSQRAYARVIVGWAQ